MKILNLSIVILTVMISGCDNSEIKAKPKVSLTCESSKAGRSKEELQVIADACFKKGSYSKSSGLKW